MARSISWNKRAVQQLEQNVSYLEEEGATTAIRNLIVRIDELLDKLNRYPEIGRKSASFKTVRQFKLTKNINLYYRKKGKRIIVVYLFDNRMLPDKNLYK